MEKCVSFVVKKRQHKADDDMSCSVQLAFLYCTFYTVYTVYTVLFILYTVLQEEVIERKRGMDDANSSFFSHWHCS